MGDVPFRTVYIHGLVRDERGQKMSKSKGNVIDPLELIDNYGADALRFTICALTGPGRDVKLGASRVESYRGFVTKLWNAARFCEMNGMRPETGFDPASVRLPVSRWLLDSANTAITEATAALEAYRFDEYAAAGYRFVWNTFCDWFLEFSKPLLAEGAEPADAAEIRLRRAVQPDRRRLAGTHSRSRRRPGSGRAGLGGAADRAGPFRSQRNERAAVQTVPGAAAGGLGRYVGPGGSLDRGDQAVGPGLRGAAADRRGAERLGPGGAGRDHDRAAAGRSDRYRG
jgi:hypothetical protein